MSDGNYNTTNFDRRRALVLGVPCVVFLFVAAGYLYDQAPGITWLVGISGAVLFGLPLVGVLWLAYKAVARARASHFQFNLRTLRHLFRIRLRTVFILQAMFLVYMGSYLQLVKPRPPTSTNLLWCIPFEMKANYTYGRSNDIFVVLFWPMNRVDRSVRPHLWYCGTLDEFFSYDGDR